jgi:hypothetical protein
MLIKPTLFLRNEEGGSPGGGSIPTPPIPAAAPAATQPAAIPVDQLKEVVGGMLTEFRNGIFADLRRTGALKPDKPVEHPSPTPVAQHAPGAPAPAGVSMADMERSIEIKFAVQQMRSEHGLSDAQATHLKTHLDHSRPSDAFSAAKSYLSDLGLAKVSAPNPVTQNTAPPVAVAPSQTTPIKTANLGAPAPGDSVDVEALVTSQPLNMSGHDYDNLVAKVGKPKAEQMVQSSINAYLKTVRLAPDNRRRR